MARLNSFRQSLKSFGVTSAEDHVIGNEASLQLYNRVTHLNLPVVFPELLHAGFAQKLFDDFAVAIRQISELQGQQIFGPGEGGTKPGAETQKNMRPP